MSQVSGVVQEIQTRSVAGGKTAYNIVVAGQSYGAGLYAPKASVGDYVEFTVDEARGYKNVARGTLTVQKNKGGASAAAPAAAPVAAKPAAVNYDARQDTISRQAAANTALQFLNLAVSTGALELPKSGKKGAQLDALETIVHEYTASFYERATGTVYKDISPNAPEESDTPADVAEDAGLPEDQPWE